MGYDAQGACHWIGEHIINNIVIVNGEAKWKQGGEVRFERKELNLLDNENDIVVLNRFMFMWETSKLSLLRFEAWTDRGQCANNKIEILSFDYVTTTKSSFNIGLLTSVLYKIDVKLNAVAYL